MALETIAPADELRLRLALLAQGVELDALRAIEGNRLNGIRAFRPADGNRIVEVDRARRVFAYMAALQAVLGEDERLR